MDLKLVALKAKVHNVAREARNLGRVVDSEAFAMAWESANLAQRAELESYVVGIDKESVDRWVRRLLAATYLEGKPFRELRDMARAAGIQYSNNKTRDDLIKELRNVDGPGDQSSLGEPTEGGDQVN